MPSVLVDYRVYEAETTRLLGLCGTLNNLSPVHQKLVAEIILLRLFDLFENFGASVATKLACGAPYVDGVAPVLLHRARSRQAAVRLFQLYGRRSQRNLRWSSVKDINANITRVIDRNDNFIGVIGRYGLLISELRCVRNRIAHNNSKSRKKYREVVRRHYGAYMNHVSPGTLLLTSRISPILIEQYIRKGRIVARESVKA